MKRVIILFMAVLPLLTNAQIEKAGPYAETITVEDLKDYLNILASDALEGRETGERGQQMAAAFIKAHFNEWGLEAPVTNGELKSYYQFVPLYTINQKDINVKAGDKEFKNFGEIMYYGQFDTNGPKNTELVYVGSGSESIIKNLNVKDKSVLVTAKDRNWRNAVSAASDAGAEFIFVVPAGSQEDFKQMVDQFRPHLEEGRLSLSKPEANADSKGIFFVSPEFAQSTFNLSQEKIEELNAQAEAGKMNKLKKVKPVKISYTVDLDVNEIRSENVMGYLPGTDLKDELVVLTAHYDHVGKNGDQIYNGADDDGSGTAAVMEIAEAFVTAANEGNRPRRSILFLLVTGEEKGLLGSEYYANNPVFPMANTIVDLNIDMIGRVDPKHEENPDYVYLVGADRLSTELHEISEEVNKSTTNLELDYTYNDEGHPDRIYYRSDHWNFAKNNVPIIFYFNGVHADYHKPTDTVDKIEWDVLKKRTHLVFYTAWELANRDKRPVVDKANN